MVGLAGGYRIGMVMAAKMKSRGLVLLGGFTSIVVGLIIGKTAGTMRNFQQAMDTGQFDANFPAGGLKECLKASITGIPPDPAVMEQYLQQPEKVGISRQQYQQGVHLQPKQPETNEYQTYSELYVNNILQQNQAPQSQQTSEITLSPPSLNTEKKFNKYGDEIFDDKKS